MLSLQRQPALREHTAAVDINRLLASSAGWSAMQGSESPQWYKRRVSVVSTADSTRSHSLSSPNSRPADESSILHARRSSRDEQIVELHHRQVPGPSLSKVSSAESTSIKESSRTSSSQEPDVYSRKRSSTDIIIETPAKKQSKWSANENLLIVDLRGKGMKWDDISKHLPGRSSISCRLHYQNFLERRAEWSDEQKTKLARLYDRQVCHRAPANIRHRKDMWSSLAKELGIPWRAVEAMHWELGADNIAQRAGVPAFASASVSLGEPSSPPTARSLAPYIAQGSAAGHDPSLPRTEYGHSSTHYTAASAPHSVRSSPGQPSSHPFPATLSQEQSALVSEGPKYGALGYKPETMPPSQEPTHGNVHQSNRRTSGHGAGDASQHAFPGVIILPPLRAGAGAYGRDDDVFTRSVPRLRELSDKPAYGEPAYGHKGPPPSPPHEPHDNTRTSSPGTA